MVAHPRSLTAPLEGYLGNKAKEPISPNTETSSNLPTTVERMCCEKHGAGLQLATAVGSYLSSSLFGNAVAGGSPQAVWSSLPAISRSSCKDPPLLTLALFITVETVIELTHLSLSFTHYVSLFTSSLFLISKTDFYLYSLFVL